MGHSDDFEDSASCTQAVLRGDGAGAHTLDSAADKAYTSASFKTDTSALVERAKRRAPIAPLLAKLPHLLLFGGGIMIKIGDEVVARSAQPVRLAAIWTKTAPEPGSPRFATGSVADTKPSVSCP